MKQIALLLALAIVPLLLFAGVFVQLDGFNPDTYGSRSSRLETKTRSTKEGSDWNYDFRSHLHYDSQYPLHISSITNSYWSPYDNQWELAPDSIIFEYDATGRVEEMRITTSDGLYRYWDKYLCTYDAERRLSSFSIHTKRGYHEEEDDGTGYTDYSRMHILYNAEGSFEIHEWECLIRYEPYKRYLFEYDAEQRISAGICYTSLDSLDWQPYTRIDYNYWETDDSNRAGLIEYLSANIVRDRLLNGAYSFQWGMLQEVQQCYFSFEDEEWQWPEKTVYTYTDDLKLYATTSYTPSMLATSRTLYSYDNDGDLQSTVYQLNTTDNGFKDYRQYEYTWEEYAQSCDDEVIIPASSLKIKAYPTPFLNELHISVDSAKSGAIQVDIYNLRGQKLQSINYLPSSSQLWDGKDDKGRSLPAGIYFLRASQDGESSTRRIMKMK